MSRKRHNWSRTLALILAFLLGLLLILWLNFNNIAKGLVTHTLTETLGLPTSIAQLEFDPTSGLIKINDLTVDNPPGYISSYLLELNHFESKLTPASLLDETIAVQNFELTGLTINIEQGLGLNLSTLLRNLEQKKSDRVSDNATPEKKIKADRLLIKNVEINARLFLLQKTIDLPKIDLKNIQAADGQGITVGEIVFRILSQAIATVAKDNRQNLPKPLLEIFQKLLPSG